MPKTEQPLQALSAFIPENTFEQVAAYIQKYKVHLTISRERASILGDYRNAHNNRNHRISVNGNLNPYAFLITLLHELAHLLTFDQYGHKVQSHGREWKKIFGDLLARFLGKNIFPPDVEKELAASLVNPAASSCAEDGLMRILRRYDKQKLNHLLIEDLQTGQLFRLKDGRVFKKGEKLRKRYRCQEMATGKYYLFSPVYEVEVINA
ncbi:hypothetical protein EXU57_12915 [Segetibacter sp. 3557_3]|uniref:SprT-like domain-containing protein n=1 Tax=Segetibacter sp. 3557_3 TaxID=2547429 RepID=UPI0010591416|nr:SprT-like domain-containing protein [Segetibacter sp. 3557_3]TDH25601.1 hypothetical protein EXU57_12915 [Segetibacter sp. 3557_3]